MSRLRLGEVGEDEWDGEKEDAPVPSRETGDGGRGDLKYGQIVLRDIPSW